MTQTIIINRCEDCPLYEPADDEGVPELCLHKDSEWDDANPCDRSVVPVTDSIPPNCPLLQSPVTYLAERKGE